MDALARRLLGQIDFDPESPRAIDARERDKRLRGDANDQYVEVTPEFSNHAEDPFVEPGFTREPVFDDVDVVLIGAGFGGLVGGANLRKAGRQRIRLIDPSTDVAGTWSWNRCPGVQCDEAQARAGLDTDYVRDGTPGDYDSEGDLDNPFGAHEIRYGGGPDLLLEMLEKGRSDGRLEGLELRPWPRFGSDVGRSRFGCEREPAGWAIPMRVER